MRYWFEESISNIIHGGVVSFLSVLFITLTGLIICTLVILQNHINSKITQLKGEAAIVVFLDDSSMGKSESLQSRIEALPEVASTTFVSKSEALERGKKVFGEFGDVIMQGFEKLNPLPSSIEVHLHASHLDRKTMTKIARKVKSFSEVESVTYEEYGTEFVEKTETIILSLGGLLGTSSVIIVYFSIALTVHFRREEIYIMKMVGANDSYIVVPLIVQGIFLGFVGSLIGIGFSYLALRQFSVKFGELEFLRNAQLISILLSGVLLGLAGSVIPAQRYTRV